MIKIKCDSEIKPLDIREKTNKIETPKPYYLNLLLLKQVLGVMNFGMGDLFNEIKNNIHNEETKDWYTISKERDALASDIVLKILSKSNPKINHWGYISNIQIENLISINHEKYLLEALYDNNMTNEIKEFLERQEFESKINETIIIKLVSAVKCIIREYTKRVSCLNKSNIQIEYSNLPTRRWGDKGIKKTPKNKREWKKSHYLQDKIQNKKFLLQ